MKALNTIILYLLSIIYVLCGIIINNSIAVLIVFVVLKLTNVVNWTWNFCLLPLMIDAVLILLRELILPRKFINLFNKK